MTTQRPARLPSPELLSLTQAARLVSEPKIYLRELIAAGRLAVYLTGDPANPKWRVTRGGLVEAGLLAPEREPGRDEAVVQLAGLVRTQTERIATLEEQRFQLGAQFGAALERIVALEKRIAERQPVSSHAILDAASTRRRGEAMRRAAGQIGEAGIRRSTELGARLLTGTLRLSARFQDGPS